MAFSNGNTEVAEALFHVVASDSVADVAVVDVEGAQALGCIFQQVLGGLERDLDIAILAEVDVPETLEVWAEMGEEGLHNRGAVE
jgi:hypothetical protein